ncbi:MAG: nucleotidyltransferase family protein [Paludibacter sp.]|nr:nucleotidyltransferase family protein [Paludibacter sp.]
MINRINSEELIILRQINLKRHFEPKLKLSPVSWNDFTFWIIHLGLGQLIYSNLKLTGNKDLFPTENYNRLQQFYYFNLKRNVHIQQIFYEVASVAAKHNIQLVALKGIYMIDNYYKDIAIRQLSDIDVLVKPEDGKKLLELLKKNGFVKRNETADFVSDNREIVHYHAMIKECVSVEVHIKLHRAIESYHIDTEACFLRLRPVAKDNVSYFALNKIDHLIFSVIHLDRHFNQGGIQFSGYMDLVNLITDLTDEEWTKIINRCEEYNCVREFFRHVILVNKYMDVNIPLFIIQKFNELDNINTELRFYEYLKGKRLFISGVPNHLSSMKLLPNRKKIQYIWHAVFPSKYFMIEKYGLKNNIYQTSVNCEDNQLFFSKYKFKFWWLWYPYRWGIGVRGIIELIRKKQ